MNMKKQYIFRPFEVTEISFRNSSKEIPRPRSGHRIVCDGTHLYCFGGYNPFLTGPFEESENPTWTPARPLFKEMWAFNTASRKWSLVPVQDLPDELASNAMCTNGRQVLIFGGTGAPFGNHCSNNVLAWVRKPQSRLQVLPTIGEPPPGQYGQAIICIDGYLYTVGGTNGYAYTCDINRLNLKSLEWEPVFIGSGENGEPFGRYRHELGYDGENLFIFAGGTGEWAFELMEVPAFNLKKKQWTIHAPKNDDTLRPPIGPLPRKCHSSVQINDGKSKFVFVIGGTDGISVFDDVWRFDLEKLRWTLMRETLLPLPLYFHSSTVTPEGCMYTFGGIEPNEDGACRNNRLVKAWLCIPKLSEMAWEAVLHYHPTIDSLDRATLVSIGVPFHFADRLLPSS